MRQSGVNTRGGVEVRKVGKRRSLYKRRMMYGRILVIQQQPPKTGGAGSISVMRSDLLLDHPAVGNEFLKVEIN